MSEDWERFKAVIIFNLDKLLAAKKMQSIELAEQLDCTVQTVSRIKTGKIKAFRMETLNALCEFFQCQPGDVLEYMPDDEAVARFGEAYVEEYKKYHNWE